LFMRPAQRMFGGLPLSDLSFEVYLRQRQT
jgi:hypothetical protein